MKLNLPGAAGKPKQPTQAKLRLPAQGEIFGKGVQAQQGNPFDAWTKDRNPQNQAELLRSLEPSMRNAAIKYAGNDDPITMGEAKYLVVKALPKYDPSRAKLETFVDRQLQPLIRWRSRRSRVMKIPDRAILDLQRIDAAVKELEIEYGREPDTIMIADHTGLSRRRIAELRAKASGTVNSSFEYTSDDDQATYAGDLAVKGNNFDSWVRLVRDDLPHIDRFILEHTLGLDGLPKLGNSEIAKKLKISAGAVSQRKARIQQKLDMQADLSPFYG